MKITEQELRFWSASVNEVLRGFFVKPSLEHVFGNLTGELENIDNLLLDIKRNSKRESLDNDFESTNITKKHLQVIRIAMVETVKELGAWELPIRTNTTVDQAQQYIAKIDKALEYWNKKKLDYGLIVK